MGKLISSSIMLWWTTFSQQGVWITSIWIIGRPEVKISMLPMPPWFPLWVATMSLDLPAVPTLGQPMNGINGLRMVCPANPELTTPTLQPCMRTLGYCQHLGLLPFTKAMSTVNTAGLTLTTVTCSAMIHSLTQTRILCEKTSVRLDYFDSNQKHFVKEITLRCTMRRTPSHGRCQLN